jgi:hypothetical protein
LLRKSIVETILTMLSTKKNQPPLPTDSFQGISIGLPSQAPQSNELDFIEPEPACCSISCSLKKTTALVWLRPVCMIHAFVIVFLGTYSPALVDWAVVVHASPIVDRRLVYLSYFGPSLFTLWLGYITFTNSGRAGKWFSTMFFVLSALNCISRAVALGVAAESRTSAFETIPLVLYIVEIIFTAVEVMFAALLAKAWKRSKGGAGAVAPVIARKNEQSNED